MLRARLAPVTLVFLSFLLLAGCSNLGLKQDQLNSRELVLERRWALNTAAKQHLGYRHSNQMTPFIHKDLALKKDLVLQGNAIDGIIAVDPDTGTTEWEMRVPNGVSSGVTVAEKRAFFGASDGHFYAVQVWTGDAVWAFPTRVENLAAPLVHKNSVYFLGGNDVVYALDADSGKQKWTYTRTAHSDLSIRGGTRPAVYDKNLYVGFSDGALAALHSDDGSLLWERQLGTSPKFKDIDSSPWVDDKSIYVSSFDNYLYALSRSDGQVQWRLEDGGAFPVTVHESTLYYSTSNGKVKAVNRHSGEILWTKKLKRGIATQPVIFEGYLIYGESDGPLKVVNAKTGDEVTQFETGRGVNAAPAVDSKTGRVYVVSNEGNLFGLAFKWRKDSENRPVTVRF